LQAQLSLSPAGLLKTSTALLTAVNLVEVALLAACMSEPSQTAQLVFPQGALVQV
jgi:hypothetical protein